MERGIERKEREDEGMEREEKQRMNRGVERKDRG
jgi:hypothetical protein